MNKDILTIKKAKELALSQEEKRTIWALIEKRGQALPVSSPFTQKDISREKVTSNISYWVFFHRNVMAGMAALFLVISGSVATFAESALPGESLYSVKVNVNEKVQALLAFTDESKASVEAALAVKRLEEVKVLAEKGNFSLQAEEAAKTRFAKHSENLKQRLEKLDAKGDSNAVVVIGGRYENGVASAYQIFVGFAGNESQAELEGTVQMMAVPMAATSRVMYDATATEAAGNTALAEDSSPEAESIVMFKGGAKKPESEQRGLLGFAEEIRKTSSKTSVLLQSSEQKLRAGAGRDKRSFERD